MLTWYLMRKAVRVVIVVIVVAVKKGVDVREEADARVLLY